MSLGADDAVRANADNVPDRLVILGRISGLFGVKGWVRVYSHTRPIGGILDYSLWYLSHGERWEGRRVRDGRLHGKGIVARVEHCSDREQAAALVGRDIAVQRMQLPALDADEFYWTDLEGLRVRTTTGEDLGAIDHLFATGANDVMVVRGDRERLIPYLWRRVVMAVDLDARVVIVDWDADF